MWRSGPSPIYDRDAFACFGWQLILCNPIRQARRLRHTAGRLGALEMELDGL